MMERITLKIGERTTYKGISVRCVEYKDRSECIFASPCADFACEPSERADRTDVMFVADHTPDINKDIETLERIAKEYPGRTIENIVNNLKERSKEKGGSDD